MKKIFLILLFVMLTQPAFSQLKITELTEDTTPTTDDMTVTVNDPSGTPATKKATIGNLLREPNQPSTLTRDTEWDSIGEIETATGVNIIVNTEIDTSSELSTILTDETGSGSAVFATSPTLTTPNIGSATGSITGNAGTATALAANPADCSVSTEFAVGILASGVATCEAIADADVPNTITIDNATTAANLGADGVDALTEISTAIKTAVEDTSKLVVGTAGATNKIAKWDSTGALVDGGAILGTLTDARYCKYTSSGTLIDCNSTCADITGSSSLCDGDDASGGSGGSATSLSVSALTPATSTVGVYSGAFTSTWTATTGTHTWTGANTSGQYFKIVNSGAMGAYGSILNVTNTGNATAGSVLQIDNTDTDILSIKAPNVTLTQAGTLTVPSVVSALTGNATTATALAANGSNCSAGSAPLGVDASGAVETCTDYEEDLSNSAGLAAALSDETGTGLAVFQTSPTLVTPALGTIASGVGTALTALNDDNVDFDDADSNFAATTIGAAIEELDDVNVSGVNASDGKVDWTQLVNVPSGFADGSDATAAGGSSTVYSDLTDAQKTSGVYFASFTNTWTSAIGNADFFKIDGSTDFIVQGDGDVTAKSFTSTGYGESSTSAGLTVGQGITAKSWHGVANDSSGISFGTYTHTWTATGSADFFKIDGSGTDFVVQADGDTTLADLTVGGGDIVLGTTSIFSGGDTASLNNIDAINATTETTFEAALDCADISGCGTGGTATSIAYDKITSPTTNSGISFAGFTNVWTSSVGNATAFTLDGSGTDFVIQGDGDTTVADLTVGGDDIFMATNTSGAVLVADGTNFNPVVMSSDAVISSAGAVTIQANSVALATDTTGNYAASTSEGGNALGMEFQYLKTPTTNSGINFGAFNSTWTSSTALHLWTSSSSTGNQFQIGSATGSLFTVSNAGTVTVGETADDSYVSHLKGYTADPCGTLPIMSYFWNNTADEPCVCNRSSVDLRVKDMTTACF